MNRPPRLNRRTAGRLLDGRPAAHAREQRLARLIEALGAHQTPRTMATGIPPQLLEAFTRHAQHAASSAAFPGGGRSRAARSGARSRSRMRSRRIGRALTIKAVLVLALSGATVAAAAADVLPAPAQSAVHELLGSWGVPAPSAGDGRVHPGPGTDTPSAVPGAPGDSPASRPAAAAPPAPSGKGRSVIRQTNPSPATPPVGCAPSGTPRKHGAGTGLGLDHGLDRDSRVGLGERDTVEPGCTGGSDGYHVGQDGGGSADATPGLGPMDAATGGEPTKKAFGGRSGLEHGHGRRHRTRREKSEH